MVVIPLESRTLARILVDAERTVTVMMTVWESVPVPAWTVRV